MHSTAEHRATPAGPPPRRREYDTPEWERVVVQLADSDMRYLSPARPWWRRVMDRLRVGFLGPKSLRHYGR